MPTARRALPLAALAAAALAAAGCSIADDGPVTTQTRDVAAFSRIDNPGSVDVHVQVGGSQRVRVIAGEKVIDDVHTVVRDGTLHVTFRHDGIGGGDVVVDASVPRLDGVRAGGSGDIEADGIDARALTVSSDGSGDIRLRGAADRVTVGLGGSGDADLAGLATREARVTVDGSGDADVRAGERLVAEVDGSGDIEYHGSPVVERRVDGSGDVDRAG